MGTKIYPVHLGTFFEVDYSHNVLNKNFGQKVNNASSACIIIDDELLVVDTGFKYTADSDAYNLKGNASDSFREKFKSLNIDFKDVSKIILTHLHWDHFANNDLFPNAKIYVQRSEVQYAAAPVDPLYYNFKLIGAMLKDDGDRLIFLDGDTKITRNVSVCWVGGHSPGSQCVVVKIKTDTVVITGDLCNVYENLEIRSPKELDCVQWRKSVDKIKAMGTIFIPAHDITVFDKYPVIE